MSVQDASRVHVKKKNRGATRPKYTECVGAIPMVRSKERRTCQAFNSRKGIRCKDKIK
jgi:hypothetical protein